MEVMEYEVDRNNIFSGRIELDREDKDALTKEAGLAQKILQEQDEELQDSEILEEPETEASSSVLSQSEEKAIKHLVQENREISQDEELLSLLVEMLYLEERPDKFSSTLEVLDQCLNELVSKANFSRASDALLSVQELEQSLDPNETAKKESIHKLLDMRKNEAAFFDLKKIFQKGQIRDYNHYLDYTKLLGPEALPLLGYIYEEGKSQDFKEKTARIIKDLGKGDISALINITDNSKPELTKEIITLLRDTDDKKAIQHLANFVSFENSAVRIETIKALGKFKDMTGDKILVAFLSDSDETLRTMAVQNMHSLEDKTVLGRIFSIVQDKTFWKKDIPERKAFLDLLGRAQSQKTCQVLDYILRKVHILSRSWKVETGLHAIAVLESMLIPEAQKILEKRIRSSNKKIRKACQTALAKNKHREETIVHEKEDSR